ncbi:MAG: hypothetical protein PHF86_04980 [Candidatus Nanoarchaeia archaeon]|nr:hypothetical protein [Candidatus Nanoarchaeia archaeon]
MKLKDFQKKCPGVRLQLGELEVDQTALIERDFFEHATRDNYRVEAIQYMTKHDIDWHSTCNSIFDVMKLFIKIKCPKCHKNMESTGGGGNGHVSSMRYVCSCGTEANLTMPNDGLSINFKEEEKTRSNANCRSGK